MGRSRRFLCLCLCLCFPGWVGGWVGGGGVEKTVGSGRGSAQGGARFSTFSHASSCFFRSELHDCVERGDAEAVRRLLTPKVVQVSEGLVGGASAPVALGDFGGGMYIGSSEGGDVPQTTVLETIEGAWFVSTVCCWCWWWCWWWWWWCPLPSRSRSFSFLLARSRSTTPRSITRSQ